MPVSAYIPPLRCKRVGTHQYAVVTLHGREIYLGPYGDPDSQKEYDRLIAEWLARGRQFSTSSGTVSDLILAYWRHAQVYYRKDGRPTGHLGHVRQALRITRQLYGRTPLGEFGPLALRAIQEALIERDCARSYINDLTAVVKRMFKWGTSMELAPSNIYEALRTVPGLGKGRTRARETAPVQPVPNTLVEATLVHLPEVVADMVRFHRLVGCRPSEVCDLRPCDVDRSGDVWSYVPRSHKTEHHGRVRVIFIGPRAQDILRPYLLRAPESYCFCPADSERKRRHRMRALRKSKVQPSQRNRSRKLPKRKAGAKYTKDSYNRAVARACERAQVPRWTPNQLRHAAATELRKACGIEMARVVLGHSSVATTELYADADHAKAKEIMGKLG